MLKVYVASDHGGFNLKEKIELEYSLTRINSGDVSNLAPSAGSVSITDLGPFELDPQDDYPQFAKLVCERLQLEWQNNDTSLGILICKSGVGMSIVANKFFGVRAALCTSVVQAQKARAHNHANVLVLDADEVSEEVNMQIVATFLTTPLAYERHMRRVLQIKQIEQANLK